mmetsp:Transcript_7618/g.16537  ORF Transcript_7618/g.16537 Transcript_7618/m.16537 type:complete len:96 (-) Transcript_7618:126-413(-)
MLTAIRQMKSIHSLSQLNEIQRCQSDLKYPPRFQLITLCIHSVTLNNSAFHRCSAFFPFKFCLCCGINSTLLNDYLSGNFWSEKFGLEFIGYFAN